MTMRTRCKVCSADAVTSLLDAGLHPVANRFLPTHDAAEERFPLVLGQCRQCGLIQLQTLVPVDALVPRYSWITYNEPEGHLDQVTEMVLALPGIGQRATVGAITYKDDSTLGRLQQEGVSATWRLDVTADLGGSGTAGLETIQDRLTPERTRALAEKYQPADVLLVRDVLGHTYDPARFVTAIRALVRPGGYVVFEVPDCSQALDTLDYTTLWEEHILYFTPRTYQDTLSRLGFDIVQFECHPYSYENSLVAIVRNRVGPGPNYSRAALEEECDRGHQFGRSFDSRRTAVLAFLADRRARGGRTAVFGAGHQACMFINLMGVAQEIAFVVDDHPAKRGMFMPGSRLSIQPPTALVTEAVDLCLSSLRPESEEKVVARQTRFIERGGRFASLFPSSRRALMFTT